MRSALPSAAEAPAVVRRLLKIALAKGSLSQDERGNSMGALIEALNLVAWFSRTPAVLEVVSKARPVLAVFVDALAKYADCTVERAKLQRFLAAHPA